MFSFFGSILVPMALAMMKVKSKIMMGIVGAIVVVSTFGVGVYKYVQLRHEVIKLRNTPQGAQEAAKEETARLIDQVRKLISVPEDETPTVATVSDSEKLRSNAFFANAQNGDKVLIYSTSKKAIIFRPGENKIIEVGPISIGTPSGTLATKPASFVLYNGTDVTGLTKKYETTLTQVVKDAVVVDRDNAKKRDYTQSIIIDLTGSHVNTIEALGKSLGIAVGQLPEGETKPTNAEYLIILGADKK